jgi:hypothetical protein
MNDLIFINLILIILKQPSLDSPSEQVSSGVPTICLLQTVFSKKQIRILLEQSKFGYLVSHMLWSYLNNNRKAGTIDSLANAEPSASMDSQVFYPSSISSTQTSAATDKRASMLYCQLNELLPGNLCEDIICTNLRFASSLAAQIDAFKRFTRLWHWSREYSINSNSSDNHASMSGASTTASNDDCCFGVDDEFPVNTIKYVRLRRTFERALLILIDMLADENERTSKTMSKLIQDWLLNCIHDYNDLPRIIDIMLVSLLHPGTSRVSVQNFLNKVMSSSLGVAAGSANKASDKNEDETDKDFDYESKVYAISNEGGNVKYHVNGTSTVRGNLFYA